VRQCAWASLSERKQLENLCCILNTCGSCSIWLLSKGMAKSSRKASVPYVDVSVLDNERVSWIAQINRMHLLDYGLVAWSYRQLIDAVSGGI
jgi:hypothetical protein